MNRREFNELLAAAAVAPPNQLAADRHRPQYHFLAKANWMNDPNGPVYHKGTYHMFFQWGPDDPLAKPNKRLWGHAISKDMVHWKHMPVALGIEPAGIESKGVWSGSVVVADGVPTALYTGGAGQHLATSDDAMVVWKRYEGNPILKKAPEGMELSGWRDPAVWREPDGWYMLVGGGYKNRFGTALLYRSPDLRQWEYLHPLLTGTMEQRPRQDITRGEDMWECPDFFPLGDKHVLIASIIGFPPKGWYTRVPYWMGRYVDHELKVERTGETDYGWAYASKTMPDARGRRIYWAWIRERRPSEAVMAGGWAGVMSLPRVLTMRSDGALGMEPLPELSVLRGKKTKVGPAQVRADASVLKDVQGDSLEIVAEFDVAEAAQYGVRVRCSPDGTEEYRIGYDAARQAVVAGSGPQTAPLALGNGERLRFQVFVDASVIEIFVNGRICIADRFYPTRTDSLGVGLYALGGTARLRSMEVWRMDPISSDRLTS